MHQSLINVDRHMAKVAGKNKKLSIFKDAMLTTLTAAVVLPTADNRFHFCVCNVGDSLAYVYSKVLSLQVCSMFLFVRFVIGCISTGTSLYIFIRFAID